MDVACLVIEYIGWISWCLNHYENLLSRDDFIKDFACDFIDDITGDFIYDYTGVSILFIIVTLLLDNIMQMKVNKNH